MVVALRTVAQRFTMNDAIKHKGREEGLFLFIGAWVAISFLEFNSGEIWTTGSHETGRRIKLIKVLLCGAAFNYAKVKHVLNKIDYKNQVSFSIRAQSHRVQWIHCLEGSCRLSIWTRATVSQISRTTVWLDDWWITNDKPSWFVPLSILTN